MGWSRGKKGGSDLRTAAAEMVRTGQLSEILDRVTARLQQSKPGQGTDRPGKPAVQDLSTTVVGENLIAAWERDGDAPLI